MYSATIGARRYVFSDLKTLLAKASSLRSGDQLAGLAAETYEERVAAQYALADLPLAAFLHEHVIPYESDEVTRLIIDTHDTKAFAPVAHLTVGGFRDWLLSDEATTPALAALAPGVAPEMAAAACPAQGPPQGPLFRPLASFKTIASRASSSPPAARLHQTTPVAPQSNRPAS
jgi:ethanolamine ammonia-lyase large subunit